MGCIGLHFAMEILYKHMFFRWYFSVLESVSACRLSLLWRRTKYHLLSPDACNDLPAQLFLQNAFRRFYFSRVDWVCGNVFFGAFIKIQRNCILYSCHCLYFQRFYDRKCPTYILDNICSLAPLRYLVLYKNASGWQNIQRINAFVVLISAH